MKNDKRPRVQAFYVTIGNNSHILWDILAHESGTNFECIICEIIIQYSSLSTHFKIAVW